MKMLMVEYGAKNFDKTAWEAIDRREPVQLVVKADKRAMVKRALEYYREYFDARRQGKRRRGVWWKFGWYGFRMPAFWAIYNHAELAGMGVATEERDDCLIVTFSLVNFAPAGSSMH